MIYFVLFGAIHGTVYCVSLSIVVVMGVGLVNKAIHASVIKGLILR